MLIELIVGLFVCSLLFVAAGRLMRQSVVAEERIEERWETVLACRTVLELSCVTESPIDTQLVCENGIVRSWSTIDSLSTGELMIRAHAMSEKEDGCAAELARLVWPGRSNAAEENTER